MDDKGPAKAHSESTSAEALQFLLTAAGVLLAMRLAHAAGSWFLAPGESDPIGQLAAPFRRGYLLADPHLIVPDGMSPVGRASFAAIIALAGGAIGAVIGRAYAVAAKRDARLGWRSGLRIGLTSTTAFALLASLLWPPLSLRLSNEGFVRIERPSIAATIGLPWPKAGTKHSWSECWIERPATLSGKPVLQLTAGAEPLVIESADDDDMEKLHAFLSDRIKRNQPPE